MIYLTAIGLPPGAVVQYTFTHKQYIEQHTSPIWKSADRALSLRGIPWHLPCYQGSRRVPFVVYFVNRVSCYDSW